MTSLSTFLNRLYDQYHRAEYLSSDPLEFPHRYEDPWDQEAVALLSAVLAYGNVKQIRRSVEDVLLRIHRLAPSPRAFVEGLDRPEAALREFSGFVHRFNVGRDLVVLFCLLRRSWKEYGSLGAHFVGHLEPGAADVSAALDALIADWKAWSKGLRPEPSFSYLLTAPKDGSCCKRWCMLLRWVGRTDTELDLGLWCAGSPLARTTFPKARALHSRQLVLPLDTHTGRISQYLGLTDRKSLGWLAALEVTEALRKCDPEDPTRYDFALARLGILDLCQRSYRADVCRQCVLLPACRFAQAGIRLDQPRRGAKGFRHLSSGRSKR